MSNIQVAAAIIIKDSQILIARRPLNKHKGGYWEFPGGKVEPSETAEQALVREIKEEINIQINSAKLFEKIHHSYPEKDVLLYFFKCDNFEGKAQGLEGQEVRWVNYKDLSQYQFPEANQPIVEKLLVDFIS